jgi:uncharacterized repeat protein (TIGR01451 family)
MSHIFAHFNRRHFTMPILLFTGALIGLFLTFWHTDTAHAQAPTTPAIIATVPVGPHPSRLAVDPTTNRIYALFGDVGKGSTSFGVSVIDGNKVDENKNPIIGTIPIDCCSGGIAVRPSTSVTEIDSRIFVANGFGVTVSMFDGNTHAFMTNFSVHGRPHGMAVNPATHRLYVGHVSGTAVRVINLLTNALEADIPDVRGSSIAVNPVTNRIYALDHATATLHVIQGTDHAVIASIPNINSSLAVNPTTNRVYAIDAAGVVVIDGETNTRSSIPVAGPLPDGAVWSGGADIAVNPLTNRIYVTGNFGRSLFVLDGSTNTLAAIVPVGIVDDAFGVAPNPKTGRVYVANNAQSMVSVLQDQVPGTDLRVSMTVSPVTKVVSTGQTLTYTVAVANDGPGTASNVVVTNNLPASTSFLACTSDQNGTCSGTGNNRTITFASLAPNAQATITLAAKLNCAVTGGTVISNTASVTSATSDLDASNNSATVATTAANPAPVVISSVSTGSLSPPSHDLVPVGLAAEGTDNCPGLSLQVFVFSDVDDETPTGSKVSHSPDAKNVALATLRLRSERLETGDGRVYLIVVKASDSGGNAGYDVNTVVVPRGLKQAALLNARAAAAKAFVLANDGNPPSGYVPVGETGAPVIGPKQ